MSKKPTKAQCEFATALADRPRVVAKLSEACKRRLANCRDVEHVTLESVYASNMTDETNSGWAGR
jgi:hypothetical protein